MKTAIYIAEGLTQFVLTPETAIDKKVVEELQRANLKTYMGQFYACQGGWTRWTERYPGTKQESLIFVVEDKQTEEVGGVPQVEFPTSGG